MRLVKEYCCCAIPILNAGIYITLTGQLVVAATAGILSLVTPPIVGASVPAFVPIVFAILCFVAAAIQLFGFLGVIRESTIIFRRYTTLHSFATVAIFVFAAVFLGISGSKHDTATSKCVKTFFPSDSSSTSTALTGSDSEGKLLCNIFTWVGLGTMVGLWAVLAIFHLYLFFVISGYGSSQRADHSKYYSLYSLNSYPGPESGAHPTFLPVDHIGMKNLGRNADAATLDTRDSLETVGFEKHRAQHSASYLPQQQHADYYNQGPPADMLYPGAARTMSPAPTPAFNNAYDDPYYQNAGDAMGRPEPSARHPAEGSFRRKTPRATPAPDYGQSLPY